MDHGVRLRVVEGIGVGTVCGGCPEESCGGVIRCSGVLSGVALIKFAVSGIAWDVRAAVSGADS